ncbi:SMP-30/gluconolactonase/LRE family protein [Actinoplanes awajinensis]|uniref:Gluconolactonase n=1 Tax=Actinoplanes awajinensis subsp. mycoplanecinus TaxID=135947 RepID=A0A101JH24_9ACTN|nr:SMP-30/gluconolactonase/LRE family protein [Actinoplanes awajinensis]KUL26301.1 gluconolactonase [Actinoplanes awajinensis subsp. mycoplanecinus]
MVLAEFKMVDERFRYLDGDFVVEQLHTGARKTEGPAYFPAGRYLVWSDIPNDRLMRWDETSGAVGVLADSYQGKRLNSPNDVVVRSDGTIWFTDPVYGIASDCEGHKADSEFGGACYVFRLDPATGDLRIVADDFCRPNGLAFSPDEQQLFIADTRQEPSHIRVFDVTADGTLTGGKIFATCDYGRFDGLRADAAGRIWAAAWDGVHCFAPDGTLIGKLLLPESVANLTFGGPALNHLFITAGTSVYTLRVTFNGAR